MAERLAARPDVAEVQRRHADYYRALAERADRPLRGAGHREWLERLEAEAGNLAAAVRWYLAHDRAPLPHLFRVLWLFWELRDHLGEARAWIGQLLPAAGSLDPRARAELLWAGVATATELHDDPAALAASQRLAPQLGKLYGDASGRVRTRLNQNASPAAAAIRRPATPIHVPGSVDAWSASCS